MAHIEVEQKPLPPWTAWAAVGRCILRTVALLAHRQIHQPARHVGQRLGFADGTTARIYRETVVDRGPTREPAVLVVEFRLRRVHGWGHAAFRMESELNTPLFVGFPGFVSKLWLAHDQAGFYRGLYEWDGPVLAHDYARALWRVLALVSEPASIHYRVVPGLRREQVLAEPSPLDAARGLGDWWRLAGVEAQASS